MNVKTLICYRQGSDPFSYDDMNFRAFGIEPEFDVYYANVCPQPRPGRKDPALEDLVRTVEADHDTYVVVSSGKEPTRTASFDLRHGRERGERDFARLTGWRATNDGILDRICERLAEMSDAYKGRN